MKKIMTKRRLGILIGISIFWILFAYIWGFWGWNSSTLFSRWWYFDTVGHIIFGFGATLTLLLYFRYSVNTWFFFGDRVIIAIATISSVALAGVFWEFLEAFWDVLHYGVPEHTRAQNSSLDTSIDILAATLAAFITVIYYNMYNTWYWRKNPNDQVEELSARIELLSEHIDQEIREQKITVRKSLRRRLKKRLRRIFRGKDRFIRK